MTRKGENDAVGYSSRVPQMMAELIQLHDGSRELILEDRSFEDRTFFSQKIQMPRMC